MKHSMKFVCAAAVAAGASIAAFETARAMPVTPVEQAAAPPPVQKAWRKGYPHPNPMYKKPAPYPEWRSPYWKHPWREPRR